MDDSGGNLSLHLLDCGYLEGTNVPFVTADGEVEQVSERWANRSYLIEHSAGLLLWDTGIVDTLVDSPDGKVFGLWRLVVEQTLLSRLAKLGVGPSDITYLGFSHMHADHTGNAQDYASATVLVHAREHAVAFADTPPNGYVPAHYEALRDSRTIQIAGSHDVFGDGSVVTLESPGHSSGHQCLVVRLPNRGPVVLSGDLYYGPDDRLRRRAPGWNVDVAETFRSMDRVEQYVAEIGATMLIHHDMDAALDPVNLAAV